MAKLYLGLPNNDTGSYVPIYISTSPSNTTSAFSISSKTLMSGLITKSGTTYKVYEVSGTIPTYYTVDNTMDAMDYWLHDENNTTNREGPYDYGDITTTVHVWECNDCAYSSNYVGYIPNMESGTVIMFFNPYMTYEPSIPTWILSGNTYNISIPNLSSNNNLWVSAVCNLTAGKTYSISVTAKSEANYDGVIVTSGQHSSSSSWSTMTGWSDYVCGATGNNVTNTATFTATSSNKTLYLYFKTDGSTISPSPETGSVTITESSAPPTPTYAWTKSGNTYSISVGDNGQWILRQVSVTINHTYSISMTVACEKNYDGIYLGTASHSSGERVDNMANNSDCIMVATSSTSGTSTTTSTTWKATTSTIYLYFYTDNSTLNPDPSTGSVTFTDQGVLPTGVTVTLNRQGGSGGSTSLNVTPNAAASACPTASVPTRSGFEFSGYYNSTNASTAIKYINADGTWARSFDYSSAVTFYAFWGNNISYSTYSSASVYCSDRAVADSSTYTSRTVSVASSSASCGTGTATYSIESINKSGSGTVSTSGWSISSDGKTLTIPSGIASGTYNVNVRAVSPSGGTAGTNAYLPKTVTSIVSVTITANAISSYGNPTVSHTTPVSLNKAGQTYTMSPTFSQTATWNNGASSTITSGGSYTYAVQTSKTGYSLGTGTNSNKVTVTNNTSTSARNGFVVRITCTVNSKSGTKDVTFNQPAGSIVYGSLSITSTYEYLYFYASGETQAPKNSITYSLPYTWNSVSGSGGTYTSGATVTYKTTGTLPSGFSVESNFSTTGRCTWASRGTTTGSARYAEDYLYVEVSLNGVTGTKDCSSCYQQANTSSTSTSTSYGTPTVEIGSGIWASGGHATVTCTVTNTVTTTTTYTSGASTSSDSSAAGTARWKITSNGNNRFSHPSSGGVSLSGVGTVYNSGTDVYHDSMTNNATTDTVVVTAYNINSTSKTATAQDVTTNSLSWKNPVYTQPGTGTSKTISLAAAGQTYTIVAAVTQKQEYTSGYVAQEVDLSNSVVYSVSTAKTGYSLDTSTHVVTVTNNESTSARNGFKVLLKCTGNANIVKNFTVTFNQPAGSQAYLNPVISGFTYDTFAASGATKTPTVTYYQDYAWNGVAGSGTRTSNTGGTLAYSTTGTLPSGFSVGSNFSTTGSVTWANNTSTSTRDAKSNLKVTVTVGGLTSSAYTCTACSQSAGAMVYSNPSITGFSYADFAASGATKSPTVTYSQTYTWNGVSGSGGTITSGGTLAYATTGTLPSGFSVASNYATSGSTTWASRTTTVGDARDAKSNLTVTVTLNGKSSTSYTCTSCKQVANAVTALALAVGSNTINYNGTTTCTATATYTSGSTLDVSGNSGTTYSTSPTGVVTIDKSS